MVFYQNESSAANPADGESGECTFGWFSVSKCECSYQYKKKSINISNMISFLNISHSQLQKKKNTKDLPAISKITR